MPAKQRAIYLMKEGLRRGIDTGIHVLERLGGISESVLLAEKLSPTVTMKTELGNLTFLCPARIPLKRAQTLLTKEPETIEWINGFQEGEVLWDIGANVGVYSLYAALRKVTVLAFEPASVNYYLLNKNIEINGLDGRISSFCIAFNHVSCLDVLYMKDTRIGGACHGFAEATDWQGKPFDPGFRQGMIGFAIDEFLAGFHPPFPNHVKIDVDGIEGKIVEGAAKTFADPRLKSVLVELNLERDGECEGVTAALENAGLNLTAKEISPLYSRGKFRSVFNHIFVRS